MCPPWSDIRGSYASLGCRLLLSAASLTSMLFSISVNPCCSPQSRQARIAHIGSDRHTPPLRRWCDRARELALSAVRYCAAEGLRPPLRHGPPARALTVASVQLLAAAQPLGRQPRDSGLSALPQHTVLPLLEASQAPSLGVTGREPQGRGQVVRA